MRRLFEENKKRRCVSLEGAWKFKIDAENTGLDSGWKDAIPADAVDMLVPSLWTCCHGYYNYEGVAWYYRYIDVEIEAGGFAVLEFDGVTGFADVFVDGEQIAQHYGGFTGFTAVVEKPGRHLLCLRVDNTHSTIDTIPLSRVDFFHHGGFTRGVFMSVHKRTRVEYMNIKYNLTNMTVDTADAQISVEVGITAPNGSPTGTLAVYMDGKKVGEAPVAQADENKAVVTVSVPGVKLWSPESPSLYRFDVETDDDGLCEMTGFRTVATSGGKILLNGQAITIKGVNRHEEHPDFGFNLPFSIMAKDLAIIKELGCNAVRGSHYPNARVFLDMCDKQGVLFWEEIPMWGFPEEPLKEAKILERGLMMHREMVARDINHPSIIFWGLHNEIETGTEAARIISEKFAGQIRSMDSSRLVTFATHRAMEDICLSLADVVCVNKYFGWYHSSKEYWKEFLAEFRAKLSNEGISDKPLIISEFGAGGVPGVTNFENQIWSENFQSEYLDYTLSLFENDGNIAGTYIWQYCDIRVCPDVILGRPRGFNNKGIVDEYRRPKRAFLTVKSHYNK